MTNAGHAILPTWTPEREARALRLFLREGFTAAEVAEALGEGVSRAAVVGKIRRLGFLKRDIVCRAPRAVAVQACAQRLDAKLPPRLPSMPLPPLREAAPTGAPRRLTCLTEFACRWPIDDPGPGQMHRALFCAGPVQRGAYCEAHRALAYRR